MIFKTVGDSRYWAANPDAEIEFEVDRLHRERGELHGELTVTCGLAGARTIDDGLLSSGNFNFSSPRARKDQAKLLAERARTNGKVDWHAHLEELCHRVIKAERIGAPAVNLREIPRPVADIDHDVDGFKFPQHHPTILFGDGGACKSLFALFLAGRLAERGLRVGFFDWELDAAQHRIRLEALFGDDMPAVQYVRCDRPLVHEVDRLRRLKLHEQLDFLVYDSAGFACAGKPEDAEQALAYFRAQRQIGGGSINIAHVSKADTNGTGGNEQKPFGSAFWHNSARSTWFAKLVSSSEATSVHTVGLFHRKSNLGPRQAALAFEVTFEATRTNVRRVNVATVDELATSLPLWQRIRDALRNGPQTLATLAEELDANVDTVDRTVRRKSALFTKVTNFPDHVTRVALVERRAS